MRPSIDNLPEFLAKLHQSAWQSRIRELKQELISAEELPDVRPQAVRHGEQLKPTIVAPRR